MNILDQEISRKGLEKCSVNETFTYRHLTQRLESVNLT